MDTDVYELIYCVFQLLTKTVNRVKITREDTTQEIEEINYNISCAHATRMIQPPTPVTRGLNVFERKKLNSTNDKKNK